MSSAWRTGRHLIFWASALGAALALGLGGAHWWRTHTRSTRIAAALPDVPELSAKPEILRHEIERANATVRSDDPLSAVAELGRLYHANGFSGAAEGCWRLLIAEQPREPRWPYYLSDLRRTASDYAEMRALLEKTTELAPDYAPAWLRLADYAFKTGDFAPATTYYRRRLALIPGDPYARLALARLAERAGDKAGAHTAVEALVRDAPKFAPAQNLLAEMLATEGNTEAARMHRWHGRGAGRMPEPDDPWLADLNSRCHDPERLRMYGTYEYQINQPERARPLLTRAVELAPSQPDGYELLGDLLIKLGEPTEACTVLTTGIERTGERATIRLFQNLGEAHRVSGDPLRAIEVARAGLQRWPAAFELHNVIGNAWMDMQNREEAIAAFERAIALNPTDPDANFNLGGLQLAAGRFADARDAFRRSLTSQPTFPKSLFYLGRMELEAGHLEAAYEYIAALYDAHPGQPHARELLARWHLRAGLAAKSNQDLPRAERHFREGAGVDPGVAENHAELGLLCLTLNWAQEAITPLETLRSIRPEEAHGAMLLGQAYVRVGRVADAQDQLQAAVALADRAGDSELARFCRELLGQL